MQADGMTAIVRRGRGVPGRGSWGAVLAAAALITVTASRGIAVAVEVTVDGFTFELPDEWTALEVSDAASGEGSFAPPVEGEKLAGAWALIEDGVFRGNLTAVVRRGTSNGSGPTTDPGARAIRGAVERARSSAPLRVTDLRAVQVDGVSAYRIRASSEPMGSPLEQLQYLIPGRQTIALTLTAPAGEFAAAESAVEEIAASLRVLEKPSRSAEMPAWMCGSFLGLLGGFALAKRVRATRKLAGAA